MATPKTLTLTLKLTDSYTDKMGRTFTIADYLSDLTKVDDEGEPKESPQETLTRLLHKGGSREFTLGRDNARKASGKPAARLYAPDLSQVDDKAVPAALVARVEAFRAEVKPAPEPKPAKPAKESAKDRKIRENEARIAELEARFAALQTSKPAHFDSGFINVRDPKASDQMNAAMLRARQEAAKPAPSAKGEARKARKAAKKEEAAKAAGAPVIHRTDLTPANVATAPAIVPQAPAPKLPVTRTPKAAPAPAAEGMKKHVDPAPIVGKVTASGLVLDAGDL